MIPDDLRHERGWLPKGSGAEQLKMYKNCLASGSVLISESLLLGRDNDALACIFFPSI